MSDNKSYVKLTPYRAKIKKDGWVNRPRIKYRVPLVSP